MQKLVNLAMALMLLSACATAPDPVPMPAEFTGAAGLLPVNQSSKFLGSGIYKEGDVIAEREVKHSRTGRLGSDLTYKSTILASSTIPAGTQIFAQRFNRSR